MGWRSIRFEAEDEARYLARQVKRTLSLLRSALVMGALTFIGSVGWEVLRGGVVEGWWLRGVSGLLLLGLVPLTLARRLKLAMSARLPSFMGVAVSACAIPLISQVSTRGELFGIGALMLVVMFISVIAVDRSSAMICYGVLIGVSTLTLTQLGAPWEARFATLFFTLTGSSMALALGYLADSGNRRAFLLELTLERERAELRRLATTDALTGVLNRRAFMEQAEAALEEARGGGAALAVLLLDIDHFKRVNDRHGHAIGDRALRAVASSCAAALGEQACFGRLGGEEFAALLWLEREAALERADQTRRVVEQVRVMAAGQGVRLTVSVGVAALEPARDEDLQALLQRADVALYEAKERGRNQVIAA